MARYDAEYLQFILKDKRYQSNPLFQARKNFDSAGMKIFLLGLRELIPYLTNREKFFASTIREIFIPKERLAKIFEGNAWRAQNLPKVCDKMFQSTIKFQLADNSFEQCHLFRKLKFASQEGLFIWFDDILLPYILDLFQVRGYTYLEIKYLFGLSSIYAVRLLEYMLLYRNIEPFKERREITCQLTLEEVRFALGVSEGTYEDRKDNFKRFVLDVAIRDIMKQTPYVLRYETIKLHTKIVAVKFFVDMSNVPAEDPDEHRPDTNNIAIETLLSLGFDDQDAQAIFSKCRDVDDCLSRINRAQGLFDRQKDSVANKLGFLRRAIESEWQVTRSATRHSESETLATPTEYETQQRKGKLLVGRKKMSYRLAETIIDHINKGNTKLVEAFLAEHKVTIKKFLSICDKHGL